LPNPLAHMITRLKEAFTHRPAFFLTQTEKVIGVSPEVSFKTMTEIYLGDLAVRASIDFLADQIAGMGFHTTMNEEYAERSDGKTAKEIVDEFCEDVGLDEVLQESARYLIGWGNIFWWVGNPKKIRFLKVVPLEIIKDNGIKFDSDGQLIKIELEWNRQPKEISGDELIHLAYNVLTAKPIGIGILQSLATPLDVGDGEQRAPFYQIKGKMQAGMAAVIEKFGGPVELWSLPGISKDKVEEVTSLVKKIPRKGARFVYGPPAGSEAKVQPVVPEITRGLEKYVASLDEEYVLGLQTPLVRLMVAPGFTEASARSAIEMAERRVMALQRFLKRGVERYLFDRVIAEAGLDPAQAQVRLNWGMPQTLDYEKLTALLSQLVLILRDIGPNVITPAELRKILREVAKLPLEEEITPQQLMEAKVFGTR